MTKINSAQLRKIGNAELHEMLLILARAFHEICAKNGIPYYMLGGTQLGAVRHKGFIPWDDDMDFGVPREYFRNLVSALKEQLPHNMSVLDITNSDLYTDVLKIQLLGTIIEENGRKDKGVNIDVFPLDYTNLNKSKFSKNFLTYLSVKYNYFAFSASSQKGFVRKTLQYLLHSVHLVDKYYFPKHIEKHSLKNMGNATAIANHYGFWNLKEIVAKNIFGKPKLYEFETIQLYGVENANAYLSLLYGDYMTLPPKEKRHIHCSNVWVIEGIRKV